MRSAAYGPAGRACRVLPEDQVEDVQGFPQRPVSASRSSMSANPTGQSRPRSWKVDHSGSSGSCDQSDGRVLPRTDGAVMWITESHAAECLDVPPEESVAQWPRPTRSWPGNK